MVALFCSSKRKPGSRYYTLPSIKDATKLALQFLWAKRSWGGWGGGVQKGTQKEPGQSNESPRLVTLHNKNPWSSSK